MRLLLSRLIPVDRNQRAYARHNFRKWQNMITSNSHRFGRAISLLAVGTATLHITACTAGGGSVVSSTTQSTPSAASTTSETPRTIDSAAVAASASAAQAAADQLAAASSAAASSAAASAAAAAAAAAAEQAAQAAAAQAASEQSAAESAAASAAAEQAAAEDAQRQADEDAAEQSAADQAAAEQSAAEQSAADEAEGDSGADGWYTPSGNWVSPETAARAIAAGISPGETVPNYLRCGTICGEGPTSGEVQWAHLCKDGQVPAIECVGIDPDAIIAAASSYAG